MNSLRLLNIDTVAPLKAGTACVPVFPAYRSIQDKTVTFLLSDEEKTGMT
jgi:hypothetical protein